MCWVAPEWSKLTTQPLSDFLTMATSIIFWSEIPTFLNLYIKRSASLLQSFSCQNNRRRLMCVGGNAWKIHQKLQYINESYIIWKPLVWNYEPVNKNLKMSILELVVKFNVNLIFIHITRREILRWFRIWSQKYFCLCILEKIQF